MSLSTQTVYFLPMSVSLVKSIFRDWIISLLAKFFSHFPLLLWALTRGKLPLSDANKSKNANKNKNNKNS